MFPALDPPSPLSFEGWVQPAGKPYPIERHRHGAGTSELDLVAVEEPLTIQVVGEEGIRQTIALTMRTPGYDLELALGWLFAEGAIAQRQDLGRLWSCPKDPLGNTVVAEFAAELPEGLRALTRNVFTSSACGVCGRSTIDDLLASIPETPRCVEVDDALIERAMDALERGQRIFKRTGGLHAVALLDDQAELLVCREDVGRHNAMDKAVGALLGSEALTEATIAVFSGRSSFELVQKAARAGIGTVIAIGPPSSLAIDTAKATGITLIGFVRGGGYNLYCRGGEPTAKIPRPAAPTIEEIHAP